MKTTSYRIEVNEYIRKTYHAEPEFLWQRFPNYAVYRHDDNRKWFAAVMIVSREKLGLDGEGDLEIINLKMKHALDADLMTQRDGILPGYHFAGRSWISVLLDGTVELSEIFTLIELSYTATASAARLNDVRAPKEWLIPANPKLYDVAADFSRRSIIEWKQGKNIKKDDIVYMYVGAPVSAILFKCTVVETDIPYEQSEKINIKALMRIRLERKYPSERFRLQTLQSEFGVLTIRGPRSVPEDLSNALNDDKDK